MIATLEIIRVLDAAMGLAINAGINIERYRELKRQNGDEPLTDEQLDELEKDARASVARL